jgi:hypothetical protein
MDDEFLTYLKGKVGERLTISFDYVDLLVWGARVNESVRLLGLTLTIGVSGVLSPSKFEGIQMKIINIARIAQELARASKSVFFIVLYSISGDSVFVVTNPDDPLNLDAGKSVNENDMPKIIERFFNTNLGTAGTAKSVNKSTSDWFHVWTRSNLPTAYVKANIDGLILTEQGTPSILLETKRSFYETRRWQPFQTDGRNYLLQYLLAKKTDLDFWTVYHKKGLQVSDASDISLFLISGVNLEKADWLTYERLEIKAAKFVELIDEVCQRRMPKKGF